LTAYSRFSPVISGLQISIGYTITKVNVTDTLRSGLAQTVWRMYACTTTTSSTLGVVAFNIELLSLPVSHTYS